MLTLIICRYILLHYFLNMRFRFWVLDHNSQFTIHKSQGYFGHVVSCFFNGIYAKTSLELVISQNFIPFLWYLFVSKEKNIMSTIYHTEMLQISIVLLSACIILFLVWLQVNFVFWCSEDLYYYYFFHSW